MVMGGDAAAGSRGPALPAWAGCRGWGRASWAVGIAPMGELQWPWPGSMKGGDRFYTKVTQPRASPSQVWASCSLSSHPLAHSKVLLALSALCFSRMEKEVGEQRGLLELFVED